MEDNHTIEVSIARSFNPPEEAGRTIHHSLALGQGIEPESGAFTLIGPLHIADDRAANLVNYLLNNQYRFGCICAPKGVHYQRHDALAVPPRNIQGMQDSSVLCNDRDMNACF